MADDWIGKYRADYSPLSADDLARDDPELTELFMNSRPAKKGGSYPRGYPKTNAMKTHCKHGHEFTPENTIIKAARTASGKSRVCRKCKAIRNKTRTRKPQQRPRKFRLTRIELRRLVDIVWNEATESSAVPSTDWADRLIDKALSLSNGDR